MKLEYPKEWYEARFGLEDDLPVAAGGGPRRARASGMATRIELAFLVELMRRDRGLTLEQLAEKSGVALERVLEIEREPQCDPEAADVKKLAAFLSLPAESLLELAGLAKPPTPRLREEALRFALRVEPVKALNPKEKEALESFMSVLKLEAT